MSTVVLPMEGLEPAPARPLSTRIFLFLRRLLYTMRRMWWKSYWHLEVKGLANVPDEGPFMLCSNHASHLDAPAILAALPKDTALKTVTAAAADVFGDRSLLAMWGKLATNCVPIERNADFALGVRKLESVLRERRPLILFPEGCRSPNGKLQDFKMGAALLSFRTNTPIIPTAIKGTVVALARKQWVPCPSDVTVQFGRPIEPAPYINAVARGEMDRKRAYADLTRRLRDTIERMRAEM